MSPFTSLMRCWRSRLKTDHRTSVGPGVARTSQTVAGGNCGRWKGCDGSRSRASHGRQERKFVQRVPVHHCRMEERMCTRQEHSIDAFGDEGFNE